MGNDIDYTGYVYSCVISRIITNINTQPQFILTQVKDIGVSAEPNIVRVVLYNSNQLAIYETRTHTQHNVDISKIRQALVGAFKKRNNPSAVA